MGPVQLHKIKAGFPASPGRISETGDQFFYFRNFKGPDFTFYHGRGRDGGGGHFLGQIGLAPTVHELHPEQGIIFFNPLDHVFQGRDAVIRIHLGKIRQLLAAGMDAAAAHQHHAHTSLCPLHEIFHKLIRDAAVFVHSEINTHGRHEKPVFRGHVSDPYGTEEM